MIFESEPGTTPGKHTSPDIEPRMFQFLDAMPVGVFIGLPGGRPYYANDEGMQLLLQDANPSAEVLESAKAYRACLAGTDDPYPVEREPMARALAGETVHCDDLELHRSDGTVVPLEVWATPVYGPAGSIDHAIVAFVDTTKRRAAEAANASQAALLELAHDAIFVRDTASRITYWNSGAERTYGFSRAEALGRVSHELLRTEFPEPREDIEAMVARDGQWEGEIVHTRSDGQVIVVASRWAAHRGTDGRLLGAMEVNRDVTIPRQRAEAELLRRASALERANIQLARSNEELEQFAYVASHDLSEPLRAISGPISLLARRYRDQLDPEADQFIEFAVDGCRRMQAIIDDLLALSRAGRVDGELQAVDCNALVSGVVAGLGARIAETGATVRVEPLPTILSQPTQLGQVFQNLISNALKFIPPGVVPEVVVSAERIGDEWDFSVTDNGIGIEARHRERIFGMFKRLHSRAEYEGSGIGLALCKRIVERQGGRIGVDAAASGRGSCFWFALPITAPVVALTALSTAAPVASTIAAPMASLINSGEAS
jgi:PAS domain S-box-containing protein